MRAGQDTIQYIQKPASLRGVADAQLKDGELGLRGLVQRNQPKEFLGRSPVKASRRQ
jgi:hypothetical protein